MAALPYMPLFVADYLADASHLTTMQHGAYLLLIMNYWQRGGPLPDDDARLARIARMSNREWSRNRDVIAEFFATDGTNWKHQRIDAELARVEAKSLKSKKAAQASVQRRFGERSTDEERPLNHTDTQAQAEEGCSEEQPKARKRASSWEIPEWVPQDAWQAFVRMRKGTPKVAFTEEAAKRVISRLDGLRGQGYDPAKLLMLAVEKGWRTVYESEECRAASGNGSGPSTPVDWEARAQWYDRHGQADNAAECRRKARASSIGSLVSGLPMRAAAGGLQ